jgi:hypothetical protein
MLEIQGKITKRLTNAGPLLAMLPDGVIRRLTVMACEGNQQAVHLQGPTSVTLWPGESFALYEGLDGYQLEAQRQGDSVTLNYTREVAA